MPDTQRTITDLLSLMPIATPGGISAQDLRDLVLSLKPGNGEIYLQTATPTTIAVTSTYYKMLGTTLLSTTPAASNWDMPVNNRLRYIGTANRLAVVRCQFSISMASGSNDEYRFRLAKNGTSVVDSEVRQFIKNASEVQNLSVAGSFEMANGDYIELFGGNFTDTTSIDMPAFRMGATSFPI